MSDAAMNSPDGNATNKRKREGSENIEGSDAQRVNRSSHGSNGSMHQPNFSHGSLGNYEHGIHNTGSELNIDQQILQHVGPQNGMSDDNALTAKAALAAHTPQHKYPPPPDAAPFDGSNLPQGLSFDEMNQTPLGGSHSTAAAVYAAREAQRIDQKPSVGSPEWHQIRKNNHKEGEFDRLSRFLAVLIVF